MINMIYRSFMADDKYDIQNTDDPWITQQLIKSGFN